MRKRFCLLLLLIILSGCVSTHDRVQTDDESAFDNKNQPITDNDQTKTEQKENGVNEVKEVKESDKTDNSKNEEKPFQFSEKIAREGFEEKLDQFGTSLRTSLSRKNNSFSIATVPMDEGLLLLFNLSDYFSKRYSDQEIRREILNTRAELAGDVAFGIFMHHIGDFEDENSVVADDSFYEYFFLENAKGESLRAKRQDPVPFINEVNRFSDSLDVIIYFSKEEIAKMANQENQLFLTFEGLKQLPERRIEFKYPFSEYYEDEFPEVLTMINES